ncbi:hypothetical protein AAVH_34752, partial [Aphelenchoides avenae]
LMCLQRLTYYGVLPASVMNFATPLHFFGGSSFYAVEVLHIVVSFNRYTAFRYPMEYRT